MTLLSGEAMSFCYSYAGFHRLDMRTIVMSLTAVLASLVIVQTFPLVQPTPLVSILGGFKVPAKNFNNVNVESP